jgi:hypothetical protein
VFRDKFTEENWNDYGTIGKKTNWGETSNVGVQNGDYFFVTGISTDKQISHTLLYKYTGYDTGHEWLSGECVAHWQSGETGA